ncbi:MAG: LamG domain-containing protein [Candidatus Poribacteria bacterium]|nr:LamG domain-containing protein [Candidatus Poribacteria bacterium]
MKRLMFLLTLIVLSITLPGMAHPKTIVTDGLVSYWTFDLHETKDGITEDVWGENQATIMGNPKIVDGYLRQGLKFGGTGDYVILDDLGNFQNQLGPSTIEFWINTSYKKGWHPLFRVLEPPCDRRKRGWGILLNASLDFPKLPPIPPNFNDDIIFKVDSIHIQQSNKVGATGCSSGTTGFPFPIADGKWHHFVYVTGIPVIDESGKEWKEDVLYLDGARRSLGKSHHSNPERFLPYTEPVYLGAINDNGKAKRYFRGMLDEVRIYNRTLTDEEVVQNFQSGIGLSVEPNQKLPTVWGALKARR